LEEVKTEIRMTKSKKIQNAKFDMILINKFVGCMFADSFEFRHSSFEFIPVFTNKQPRLKVAS